MAKPTRILVVDDELVIRHLLGEVLRDDGFEVTTAADGAEGLRRFRIKPADLVISDTHMPNMDGPALLRALRSRQPGLPVIIMDSIPDDRIPMHDERTAHLSKPFALTEMRDAVTRLDPSADVRPSDTPNTKHLEFRF